jgi:hypothetical protein
MNNSSEYSASEQLKGRRRFDTHKNGETAGLPYGYSAPSDEKSGGYQQDRMPNMNRQGEYSNPYSYGASAGAKHDSLPNYAANLSNPSPYKAKLQEKQNASYVDQYNQYRAKQDEGKFDPSSNMNQPEYYPNYSNTYQDEIEKLKAEIRRREEEVSQYQPSNSKPPVNEPEYTPYLNQPDVYADRQMIEQKKLNSFILTDQINEKMRAKAVIQQEKDRETAVRLEMIKKIKEDEAFEKMEKARKAREYREQLEVQNLIKINTRQQEKMNQADYSQGSIKSSNSVIPTPFPTSQRFTRNSPKTSNFNPITGVLIDSSNFNYPGPYDQMTKDGTESVQSSNILAGQRFTRSNPKVVQSFPITGYGAGYEWKPEQEFDLQKVGDKNMAGYGQRLVNGGKNYR